MIIKSISVKYNQKFDTGNYGSLDLEVWFNADTRADPSVSNEDECNRRLWNYARGLVAAWSSAITGKPADVPVFENGNPYGGE